MKKVVLIIFLLAFSTQAGTTCEKAGALTGLVVSVLTLGYAITATVLGAISEPGRYMGCENGYSLIYCNTTSSTYQCGNAVSDGNTAFCINQATIKNPKWAQDMLVSGIVLDVVAPFSIILFSVLTYSAFRTGTGSHSPS